MKRIAIVAGATGLTGGELLEILLREPDYDEVLVLVRKAFSLSHPKLTQLVVDFDRLEDYVLPETAKALFCCLGSTITKTPNLETYRKIDHDYPLKLAGLAAAKGIRQFHFISSIGADPKSSSFYLKTKGETEGDLKAAGIETLYVYRPALLVGNRREHRLGEGFMKGLMKLINPLLIGRLKRYRSIKAATVANFMFNCSKLHQKGFFLYNSEEILA